MKKNRGKAIFIFFCIAISIYFLYPTYKDYSLTKQIRALSGADSSKFYDDHEADIRDARQKRIKLGLDLQGGMRVVLEVNTLKLLEDLAKNKDETFNKVFAQVSNDAKTTDVDVIDALKTRFEAAGVRISRYYGSIRDNDNDIVKNIRDETTNAVDRAKEIVRNRVDQYGVSEPSIQKQGDRRIIVELPGVSKEAEVRSLLQGVALLEFKLLIEPEIAQKVYDSIDKTLAGKPLLDSTATDSASLAANADSAKADTSKHDTASSVIPEDQTKAAEKAKKEHPFYALANPFQAQNQAWSGQLFSAEDDRAKVMRLLDQPEIKHLIPQDMGFCWSAKPLEVVEGKKYYALYAVKKTAELTGGVVTNARSTIDPTDSRPVVNMEMSSEGSREWARITGANIKKRIAIIMDGACFSAPTVQNKITGGNSQITGMESVDEAHLLEIVLKAGALPAPVEIVQEATVGPSLGEDSIRQGVWAAMLALGLTVAFMLIYYRSGGTMADIALLLNILFVLGVLAAFQGTLTLPGIAGVILTVAVAVDANVLIYERIREESVTGKTLTASIDAGYTRAFTAIFDANFTAFITGVILYQFGTGPVQGFALTLMIGIVASVFSAVVVSRVIIEFLIERGRTVNFG